MPCGILPSSRAADPGMMKPKGGIAMEKRPKKRPPDLVDAIICEQRRHDPTDVLGSWTGVPWDAEDEPVQDADDL